MEYPKSISFLVKAGYQAPDAYLQAVLKMPLSAWGAVTTKKDGTGLDIHPVPHAPSMDVLKNMMKMTEGRDRIIFCANLPSGFTADSIQPFRMLALGSTKPILAATLVGDFSKHATGEKNSPEFWCANGHLKPKIEQLYRLCGSDTEKVWTELGSDLMTKEIMNLIGLQGGRITLFLYREGEAPGIRYYDRSIKPTSEKFTWGDTTHRLDYVSGVTTETPDKNTMVKQPKVKRVVMELDAEEVEDDPPANNDKELTNVPVIKPSDAPKPLAETFKPIEIQTPDGGSMRSCLVAGKVVVLWFPPLTLSKINKLQSAYKVASKNHQKPSREFCENREGVEPNENLMKYWDAETKRLSEVSSATVEKATPRQNNDERTVTEKHAGATEKVQAKNIATGSTVTSLVTPKDHPADTGSPIYSVITKRDKDEFGKLVKHLDKNGQSIVNPDTIQSMEETQNFAREIGYPGLAETMGWKDTEILAICMNAPRIVIAWTFALRKRICDLEKELAAHQFDPALAEDVEDADLTPVRKKA